MVSNEHPALLFIPHCFEGGDSSTLEFNVCHFMAITGVDRLTWARSGGSEDRLNPHPWTLKLFLLGRQMVLFSLSKLCINKWPSGLVPSECLLRLTVVFHQDEPSPVPYAPANILIQFKGHVLFKLTEPSKVLTRAPLSLTPYRRKGIKKTITLRKLDHVNWLERKKKCLRGEGTCVSWWADHPERRCHPEPQRAPPTEGGRTM